nr:flagellar basal-body MS-ring/collar protein FliF [Roseivivax sp. THAF30]
MRTSQNCLPSKEVVRQVEAALAQILALWNGLSAQRRIVVVASAAAMFVAVLILGRIASRPDMALLYAGLEPQAAGDVIAAIEAQGMPYEVRGGAILVPRAERDALRLTLAGEGLPANGAQGYELLDSLTGFGTTSQMFDAAYWRAKEGELARTIAANPLVAATRVHIANASANPFQRRVNASASVSVTGTSGPLPPEQARAIRYLVASAVPGLSPEDVAVIDSQVGLLNGEAGDMVASAEDRADALRERVQRIVDARVGPGNAVVAISVDTITESESIRERRIDPDGRALISSDTEEREGQSKDGPGNGVTVASNLPDGDGTGGEGSSSQESSTRERVNYEVSETLREVTRTPGAIRRLTVAVLVNGTIETGAEGDVFTPMPDSEQDALRALVASAVGYDEARGDEITIRSLPFDAPEGLGTEATAPGWISPIPLDLTRILQMAVVALVALVLGLFVVRPILKGAQVAAALPAPDSSLPTPASLLAEAEPLVPVDGEIDMGDGFQPMSGSGLGAKGFAGLEDLSREDPVDRLRGMIEDRKEEAVEILRSWLDEPEEHA